MDMDYYWIPNIYAYLVALLINQVGTFIQTHNISTATIIITLIVIIALLLAIRKILRNQKSNGCSCGCSGCTKAKTCHKS